MPFLYQVVDERSERDDLMHYYDAVARLAEAQMSSLTAQKDDQWKQKLAERNFIRPGVLWWAFDCPSALERATDFHQHLGRTWEPPKAPPDWAPNAADRACGPVVLIDEIDKADPSVPNGLLECLGNEGFHTAQLGEAIRLRNGAKPPLVIITTNEERELPAAFLRRCLVLHMVIPKDRDGAIGFLEERATGLMKELNLSPAMCREVAECIVDDRAEQRGRAALPGASEFLELLRALAAHAPGDKGRQADRLREIKKFVLQKHDPIS